MTLVASHRGLPDRNTQLHTRKGQREPGGEKVVSVPARSDCTFAGSPGEVYA